MAQVLLLTGPWSQVPGLAGCPARWQGRRLWLQGGAARDGVLLEDPKVDVASSRRQCKRSISGAGLVVCLMIYLMLARLLAGWLAGPMLIRS